MSASWHRARMVAAGLLLIPACEPTRSDPPANTPPAITANAASKEHISPVPIARPMADPEFVPAPPRDWQPGIDPGYVQPNSDSAPARPHAGGAGEPPSPTPTGTAGKTRVELAVKESSLGKPPAGKYDESTGDVRVAISPDARRIAYTRPAGTGFVVVVGGEEWPNRYARVTKPVFSPDGKRVACLVSANGGRQLVVDGSESGAEYRDISDLRFSPDGRTVLEVRTRRENDGQPFFVIDGNEVGRKIDKPHTNNSHLVFSTDGKHYAYAADDGRDAAVILDGKTVQTFRTEQPVLTNPRAGVVKFWFTADGRLVYLFHIPTEPGWTSAGLASSDGRGLATYAEKNDRLDIARDEVCLSPDGKRVAALVSKRDASNSAKTVTQLFVWGTETLQVEAVMDVPAYLREGARWDTWGTGKFQFSPDGKRFGFIRAVRTAGSRPDQWERRLVIDGKEVTSEGRMWDFAFSPDGTRLAYAGDVGLKPQLVVDGRTVEKTADNVTEESRIFFSPNGKHVAVTTGRTEPRRLFVDGVEGPPFRLISEESIRFGADGERLAYVAGTGSHSCVVTDGVEGKAYASVGSLRFSPGGKHLAYQAQRGHDLLPGFWAYDIASFGMIRL